MSTNYHEISKITIPGILIPAISQEQNRRSSTPTPTSHFKDLIPNRAHRSIIWTRFLEAHAKVYELLQEQPMNDVDYELSFPDALVERSWITFLEKLSDRYKRTSARQGGLRKKNGKIGNETLRRMEEARKLVNHYQSRTTELASPPILQQPLITTTPPTTDPVEKARTMLSYKLSALCTTKNFAEILEKAKEFGVNLHQLEALVTERKTILTQERREARKKREEALLAAQV